MKQSFYERNAFRILVVAALLFFPIMGGALRALRSNRNDVAQWLPSEYHETEVFQWFRSHFAGEQFILASWDGCTLDDQRLRLMVDKLSPAAGRPPEKDRARYFKEVLTGPATLNRLTSEPVQLDYATAADRLKGSLIGPDGESTCIVFTLSDYGKDRLRAVVNTIRSTASAECGIPLAELHMGGPPIDNVAIDEAGEQSLYRLAGLAAAIGLVISWWCLRNAKLIAMVFFAGIYSAAMSLAIVWYSGHIMNAILLTMPSLVYVATISGAIHLSNYYRDELAAGVDVVTAPKKAIQHAWLPLTLATATTSIGLLTLCISELVPIQLFGLYSAIGVVCSAIMLFFLLPAAFQSWPLRGVAAAAAQGRDTAPADPLVSARWRPVGEMITRRQGWITCACLLILVVCGFGMTRIKTSVHMMRLFPSNAKIISDYHWLEQHLGELVPMEIVLVVDPDKSELNFLERMELVRAVQHKAQNIPGVGSALSAVTFAPPLPRPEDYRARSGVTGVLGRLAFRDQYQLARTMYNKNLQEHRDEYLEGDYLAIEEGKELWRVSARVGALTDVDYGTVLAHIKAEVDPIVAGPAANGGQGVRAVYTGLVPLIYKAQNSLLDGLVFGFVTDFLLITIIMMLAVRDWSAGLILAVPSIFPAIVIFGLMGWLGIVVDIGTVMAPAVALGVTVDDVVHFMINYRNGLRRGLVRPEAVMYAYKACARPMYQSWGVIGLGLSVFALSPFTPTQRFGYLMVTLLSAALVGNLLLLPALLAGPLGALFGRRYTTAGADEKPRPAGRPAPWTDDKAARRPGAAAAEASSMPHASRFSAGPDTGRR
ncbi:MAG: MMPL family transporter [Pirellulales bacterium]